MLSEFKVDRATETDIYGYCVSDSGDAMIAICTISSPTITNTTIMVQQIVLEGDIADSTRTKILCQRKRRHNDHNPPNS